MTRKLMTMRAWALSLDPPLFAYGNITGFFKLVPEKHKLIVHGRSRSWPVVWSDAPDPRDELLKWDRVDIPIALYKGEPWLLPSTWAKFRKARLSTTNGWMKKGWLPFKKFGKTRRILKTQEIPQRALDVRKQRHKQATKKVGSPKLHTGARVRKRKHA